MDFFLVFCKNRCYSYFWRGLHTPKVFGVTKGVHFTYLHAVIYCAYVMRARACPSACYYIFRDRWQAARCIPSGYHMARTPGGTTRTATRRRPSVFVLIYSGSVRAYLPPRDRQTDATLLSTARGFTFENGSLAEQLHLIINRLYIFFWKHIFIKMSRPFWQSRKA